jgi:hypothetical protein
MSQREDRKLTAKAANNWLQLTATEKEEFDKKWLEKTNRWRETDKAFAKEFSDEIKIVDSTLVNRLIELCEKYKNPENETQLDIPGCLVLEEYRNGVDNLFFYILTRPEISSFDKMKFMDYIKTNTVFSGETLFKQDNYDSVVNFRDQDGNNILASILCDKNIDSKTKLVFSEYLFELKLNDLFTFENTKEGSKYEGYNVGICPEQIRVSKQDETDNNDSSDINEEINAAKLKKFLEQVVAVTSGNGKALEFRRKVLRMPKPKSNDSLSELSLSSSSSDSLEESSSTPSVRSESPFSDSFGRPSSPSSRSESSFSTDTDWSNDLPRPQTANSIRSKSSSTLNSYESSTPRTSNSSSTVDWSDENAVGNIVSNTFRLSAYNDNASDRLKRLATPKFRLKPNSETSKRTQKILPMGGAIRRGKRQNTKKKKAFTRRRARRQ